MSNDILRQKLLWYLGGQGEYDEDCVYFYEYIEKYTGASRRELKKVMDTLKDEGIVILVRGLISEDGGGYYGSGHMLTSYGRRFVPQQKPE